MRKVCAVLGVFSSVFMAGLILGLGFIAAAVKFTAVKPELLDLLDVGRVQFAALHYVEVIFIPTACFLFIIGCPRLWGWGAATLTAYFVKLLTIQPAMNARMTARLAGQSLPESGMHQQYVWFALGVLFFLGTQGIVGLMHLMRQPQFKLTLPTRSDSEHEESEFHAKQSA